MSRCFPYPPPGYVSKSATGDALIDSIKIKRDTEKVKQERKEQKRRDKEERKKEKKDKKREKERLKSIPNDEGTNKRKWDGVVLDKSVDKSWVNSNELRSQKKIETEAEQLERSSLSEEHGQPVSAESLSYSSDGTQSKTKRIRIEQFPLNGNCTTQGKAIRFRLKRREHDSAHLTDDVPSTSGRSSTPVNKMFDALTAKDETCFVAPTPIADKDTKDAIPVTVEQLAPGTTRAARGSSDILPICSSSVLKAQKKPRSAYEALFSNWVPSPIHFEAVTGNADEQWLFPYKKQTGQNRSRVESVQPCSLWPRAHHLPGADFYVLPFTVPL